MPIPVLNVNKRSKQHLQRSHKQSKYAKIVFNWDRKEDTILYIFTLNCNNRVRSLVVKKSIGMMFLSILTNNHNNKFKFDLLHILLVNYFPVSFKSISFREILRLCSTCHHLYYVTFLSTRGFLGSMFVTYFRNSSVTFSPFVLQTRV